MIIRQSEQVAGPLPRLNVLKGNIIDRFTARIRVTEIAQHLLTARADIDFARLAADGLHERPGIGERALAGGKTGHGVGFDVRAWIAQHIHGARCDDQGMCRIKSTGDPQHHLGDA
jgi:hypothetical protein